MSDVEGGVSGVESTGEVSTSQQPRQQVRLRIDQRDMAMKYVNAFRTNPSADELVLDLGFNMINSVPGAQGDQPQSEILFEVSTRAVMSYSTAKRMAISLGQIIQRYEAQFGEISAPKAKQG